MIRWVAATWRQYGLEILVVVAAVGALVLVQVVAR